MTYTVIRIVAPYFPCRWCINDGHCVMSARASLRAGSYLVFHDGQTADVGYKKDDGCNTHKTRGRQWSRMHLGETGMKTLDCARSPDVRVNHVSEVQRGVK